MILLFLIGLIIFIVIPVGIILGIVKGLEDYRIRQKTEAFLDQKHGK